MLYAKYVLFKLLVRRCERQKDIPPQDGHEIYRMLMAAESPAAENFAS